MSLLAIQSLQKSFVLPEGGRKLHPSTSRSASPSRRASSLALRGESGSGKTTFLHLIAGILAADAGSIQLGAEDMAKLGEPARDRLRARTIGYVFQTFNLLQGYSCLENVLLGMSLLGPGADRARAATAILQRVGLEGPPAPLIRASSPPGNAWQRVARWPGRWRTSPASSSRTSRPATWTGGTPTRPWP